MEITGEEYDYLFKGEMTLIHLFMPNLEPENPIFFYLANIVILSFDSTDPTTNLRNHPFSTRSLPTP